MGQHAFSFGLDDVLQAALIRRASNSATRLRCAGLSANHISTFFDIGNRQDAKKPAPETGRVVEFDVRGTEYQRQ
jgi:hypothetical protein